MGKGREVNFLQEIPEEKELLVNATILGGRGKKGGIFFLKACNHQWKIVIGYKAKKKKRA